MTLIIAIVVLIISIPVMIKAKNKSLLSRLALAAFIGSVVVIGFVGLVWFLQNSI